MANPTYSIPVPPVVYVVDDDEAIRELVVEIARSIGATSKAFARAEDFLQSYRTDPIECLVVDIRMPGLSGLEVQRRLIEAGHRIPILFVTGYGDVDTAVEAMRAGAMDSSRSRLAQVPWPKRSRQPCSVPRWHTTKSSSRAPSTPVLPS